ncbi:adenylyl cyclase [Stakelama saccharophila]|uniref:Adenylyl cyclase n=1 Tax=Stakelama saccharophila TaxID=3075605 RepID=A0ABZ0BAJ8_9SPHN|nr:adenylyl cyclase [Stakelama sp. W311]WNO54297.1 adenylyl cyclase [Stakelama sp. W311]
MESDRHHHPGRRGVLAGLAGSGAIAAAWRGPARAAMPAGDPDFGPGVIVVDPDMPAEMAQARLDAIFRQQERAHFTDRRYAVLLKPGRHALDINVGFFTQVAGLGALPGDTTVDGHVHAEADWHDGMALVNFWRGVENMAVRPPDGADRWAVSQAAPYRRMHLAGDLALDDGGWSSGGFIADSRIDGTIASGTQQQWFTRSSTIGGWRGSNWNMMFMGVKGAPDTSFPEPPYTTLAEVPVVRDKPFLYVTADGEWRVFKPALRRDGIGAAWADGMPAGTSIALADFLIVKPGLPAERINAGLAAGRHLLFTPGIHRLAEPVRVTRPDTVVLGLGLATLLAERGATAMTIADVPGVALAGLLFDAGPEVSPVLLEVGPRGARGDHAGNPVSLSDLFFRVGGATPGRVETCCEINSHHVIGDHLWIWRADHGDRANGRVHVGWEDNTADQGLVVNGDDVTIYGLFVEHFQKYQTLWNGERGRTYFYQNELPYDPPSQAGYMAGNRRGYAAYKVADHVDHHLAVGMGIYANFTADPSIVLESAIEAPEKPDVVFRDVTTISLGGGKGTIAHIVNDAGAAARKGAIRQTLVRYPPG